MLRITFTRLARLQYIEKRAREVGTKPESLRLLHRESESLLLPTRKLVTTTIVQVADVLMDYPCIRSVNAIECREGAGRRTINNFQK